MAFFDVIARLTAGHFADDAEGVLVAESWRRLRLRPLGWPSAESSDPARGQLWQLGDLRRLGVTSPVPVWVHSGRAVGMDAGRRDCVAVLGWTISMPGRPPTYSRPSGTRK